MHGPDPAANYAGSYSDDDLRCWAERITTWDGDGKDVWMYFNNDLGGHAVRNAPSCASWWVERPRVG